MDEIDLSCRCMGRTYDTPCRKQAENEDGLCMFCRWPDGTCCEGKSTEERRIQFIQVTQRLWEMQKKEA